MFARPVAFATLALAGFASAQLQIISPGGPNLWWVANSQNSLVWNCQQSQFPNFTVLVANTNPDVLVAPAAIIPIQSNFDCSKTITIQQANFNPGVGYSILFSNPFNETDVYTQSQLFEIKALGAAYPAASATPTGTGSSTSSGSATSSANAPTNSNAADTVSAKGLGMLGALVAGAAVAML